MNSPQDRIVLLEPRVIREPARRDQGEFSPTPEISEDPPGAERRDRDRTRCLLPARIQFDDGFTSIDCVVRNISARGALIIVSASTPLPIAFDLVIPRRNETLRAIVRWSDTCHYGVAFDVRRKRREPDRLEDDFPRLVELENEIAKLKERISVLERAAAGPVG